MNDYSNRAIRSEEITIDVRICAALAANRGGEVYLAAIAPDMELTVITLDEAPDILPCFEEDDACLNLPNTSLLLCYNPAQVLKMGGKHYLTGPVILVRTNMDGEVISLTIDEVYLFQKYLASHSIMLVQLIALPKLPLVEVTDYPDVPYRGVVEGFYGVPWSREARLSQLDFYGRNKMNIYIYGPKDDPYHSSPNWRKPYPAQEAEQLKELVECARRNEVLFYWAIHPGKDIRWNTEDRDLLMEKFESMYRLGIRAFAVFFDDISGEGTSAEKQVELLNDIYHNFVKVKGDVAPLLMCPTEYNRLWTKLEGGYLATLGGKLHPDIGILWTGDKVVACIDKPTMQFVNPLLKRKAFIWWNFPVSDYVRDRLLLGAVYGNGTDIDDDISAFISNPMEHAEASKIALFSIADYAWNMDAYKSDASWRRAVRYLMPGHAAALQVFASHNSDLGGNEHDFRREESEQIRPALERLLDAYCREGKREVAAASAVTEECERMIASADLLLASDENPALIKEISPWLMQFKLLGEFGREVLCMLAAQCDGKKTELEKAASHAKALQVLMKKIDATYNQNGFQPGVKTGSCHLKPAFDRLYQEVVQRTGK